MQETSSDLYETLLHHIVMPRVLPQSKHACDEGIELHLLSRMTDNVENSRKWIPPATVRLFSSLRRSHLVRTKETVSNEINGLQAGESFAMFIRRQNTAFMIHMPKDQSEEMKTVIVMTFPGNVSPEQIYRHPSDLQFTYPAQALEMKFTPMMRSKEFAHQLCVLYETLPIERKNRNYVNTWLTSILSDQLTAVDWQTITKKLRDEVLGESKKSQSGLSSGRHTYKSNYFRRSNFYTAMKVFLHLSLTVELGAEHGRFVYKIVMLQFMTRMCEEFKSSSRKTLNVDLIAQLMAKVARRIEKLEQSGRDGIDDNTKKFYTASICQAKESIAMVRHKIDKQIERLQLRFTENVRLMPLIELDFVADVHQQMPKLREYLKQRESANGIQNIQLTYPVAETFRRHAIDRPDLPAMDSLRESDKNLFLVDCENWILYHMKFDDKSWNCETLCNWYSQYESVGDRFHANDPIGISRMLLVRLKLVAIMDRIASKAHPLLLEHHTNIDAGVFNILLLPQKADMHIAFELQQYFDRRNGNANDPGLIEQSGPSSQSFSVKFAERNGEMQTVRRDIQAMGERKIEKKRLEWERVREEVRQLRNRAARLNHEYRTYTDRWDSECTEHCSDCSLCSLESQIEGKRIQVYERPLPNSSVGQNSVVFELRIPVAIAALRDALHLTTQFGISASYLQIKCNWIDNHQISYQSKSKSAVVRLGSQYVAGMPCYHVDLPFDSFVSRNSWDCILHASHTRLSTSIAIEAIKSMCTLSTESQSAYAGLQWTLNTTSHTQNQVLARQSECPPKLSLAEYKNFGSLRADGHRLQLRKLYAMFETESLSFNQWSVSSLIQQTLWETGTSDECHAIRSSHTDFQDKNFTTATMELLGKFADKQKDNWVHPIKLLTATLVAVRMFEINDDEAVADKLVMLLNKIRAILAEWMKKIENTFQTMQQRDQTDEQTLRLLLVIVAIGGALTFFVSSQHEFFGKIFTTNDINGFSAARMWLQSIVILKNNIVLGDDIHKLSQTNLRMFIRLIRFTGVHIEEKIRKVVIRNRNSLFDLIKRQWAMSAIGQFPTEVEFSESRQVIIVCIRIKGINKYVTIDMITGSFLVDNLPVARLPPNIGESAIFQRTFEQYVFEVQPDASNSFSTVYKYNDCSYEFRSTDDNNVIITEHRADRTERELIPHAILAEQIPEMLVLNHSHWWNKHDGTIDLRPKEFTAENFSNPAGVTYKLDMNVGRLIDMKTGRYMLDVNSGSYQRIRQHLARLERRKYIHVLMDSPKIATIELIRMNLKFKIDCSAVKVNGYDMVSNEFSQMRVSLAQNCGTLFGLNHGLLLDRIHDAAESMSSKPLPSSKLLILPHSTIRSACKHSHVSVDIDLKAELLSPPFHRYQTDAFLRQLKPSNSNFSAWFYLAHLHALTSHGEIEPFTGMSGTQRALQILQSSAVWSTAPYNTEALTILRSIADLSPHRQIQENVQSVAWPQTIPNSSAQDTFSFIVNQLIADSHRLSGLHFCDKKLELKEISNSALCIRDYCRCLSLKPNLRVLDAVMPHEILETNVAQIPSISYSSNTLLVSMLYHRASYIVRNTGQLKSFLTSGHTIDGPVYSPEFISNVLNHDVTVSFEDLWISMYDAARKQLLNREQFALLWSLFSHKHESLESILVLQTIAENPESFIGIDPPRIGKYQTFAGLYQEGQVKKILTNNYNKPSSYDHKSWSERDRKLHDLYIKIEINRLTSLVSNNWPCNGINLQTSCEDISIATANSQISTKLLMWNNNRKLHKFIDKIECKLREFMSVPSIDPVRVVIHPKTTQTWPKYQIDVDTKMTENLDNYKTISREATAIWKLNKCPNHSAADWWKFYEKIVNSPDKKYLIDAGIYPLMVPSLVLPQMASETTNPKLKSIIGALATTVAYEQRLHRIDSCKNQPQLKPAMDRELENEPHVNWKPCDYPEWLLFEIEQNLTIRRIQIEIAKRMIEPPERGTKHSVMQLNMGEGKTAVIVPILAAVLADGTQACQITVLKSLFATNLNSLRQYLGGMLNRRMYTFPCRRDMPISGCVSKMLEIYEECKRMKGIILTLPEYRLSFQLKIYESVQKGDIAAAGRFLAVHQWIDSNVRSILDESDAILHAKYQLIYTVGNQMPLDGGVNRWTVTQAVLKRVPYHMKCLYENFGAEKVQFDPEYITNGHVYGAPTVNYRPDVFTPCRIIDESIYAALKTALIEDFVNGRLDVVFPEMTASTTSDLKELLSRREINADTFNAVMNDFVVIERDIIMILSGLLRFEVLKLALMKRWRVNYGVKDNGTRKMAVPFKAKDVASEMTEFGHPDVAICLTQLSYYYSGLTDHQLLRVFEVLKSNQNAAETYEKWISKIPAELIAPSIESYSGVNLSDPNQREQLLFPLFRFNMYVIDFWLSIDVYPREAKTFEKKLICTAWDLCSDHMQHRVTGFSGTNDTRNILPLPIAQNDLSELEETNENVRRTLLRPENQAYEKLPANVSGKMILQRLVDKDIPVLLDSGALMLELNNEQMAREWLRLVSPSKYDAVVYFDSSDILQTVDRNEIVAEFDCSVYRSNLHRCLVYLDDAHTRGTDLKFPLDWRACVTLSGDIARDKTVQACMRMRQLGNSHSIAFWASHEADIRIRQTCNLSATDSVTNEHVIEFICANSRRFETENTVHWAAGAHNYSQKLAAHKVHADSLDQTSMINLYEKCVDSEFVTLANMYGDSEAAELTEISARKFQRLGELFAGEQKIVDFINDIGSAVFEKLEIQAPNVTRFRHTLDEEQEKELEHELEEERQIERPPSVTPETPVFDAALKVLFSGSAPDEQLNKLKSSGGIVSLSTSLANTQLFHAYTNDVQPWSGNLFVTKDFTRVIKSSSFGNDDFLRPIWWIGCVRLSDRCYGWILLSSFECDRLMSTFHKSKQSTLFMYRPRLSKFHDNLLNERRLHVTGMVKNPFDVDLKLAVEIGVYAGSMFFKTEAEQNEFCGFLGLIPRPRTPELETAFANGIIKPNGFVPRENRLHSVSVWQCVGACRFDKNAVDLVINLISAHHQFVRKESHVASIVDRGFKLPINNDDAN